MNLIKKGALIVGQESKPFNSDFYQNDVLSTQEYQTHGVRSVKLS